MWEEAVRLFPARRQAVLLVLLWLLSALPLYALFGVSARTGCGALFAAALLWLAFLDVRDGMLYDCIMLPFALLGIAFSMAGFLAPFTEALIGGTLCGVLFYCLHMVSRGGMGGGDVKFAAGLGVWLGWQAAVIAVWTAFMLGGFVAAALLLTGRKGRHDGIAFGPCLSAGGYLGFLMGDMLWQLYWGLC